MLKKLVVKSFAIIEDLTVDFADKMTVLTGETGAGKSLIIDTISLLLGARADSDMIRYGQNKAIVEGVFSTNASLDAILTIYNIPLENEITILREIQENKSNVIKINNTPITLAILKNIAVYLADIHIQNDTYKLFNPDNYLDILDPKNDSKFDKLIAQYAKAYYNYLEALKEYEHIQKGQKTALEKLEYMIYERDEISALNLYENIDNELEEKIAKLSNYDKIYSSLSEAYNSLENDYNPLDMLYDAARSLEHIAEYDKNYEEYSSKLLDSYYIADEIKNNISRDINNMDYNEEELNLLIENLNEINKVKDKYKKTIPELMAYLHDISLEIDMVTNYDDVLKEAQNKTINLFNILCEASNKLTEYRIKLANNLTTGVLKECKDLDLENTDFEIVFKKVDYSNPYDKSIFKENGTDEIDLLVSFNKGEPKRSLHKVASGGEMSRMMLAFKSILSKKGSLSLMVFDEIDTGVSGSTAKKIALKMHEISQNVQVLCITHLPQVAAIGDNHKHIYKLLQNNRTITQIKDLSYEERVEEIALMLSGDKMSIYALEHAKALLN